MNKELFKQARIKAGLSRQQLADKVGVSRQTIYLMEREGNDNHSPSIDIAIKLADALGLDVRELAS